MRGKKRGKKHPIQYASHLNMRHIKYKRTSLAYCNFGCHVIPSYYERKANNQQNGIKLLPRC